MSSVERIGFMQGRLCPMVGNKIQAFPWADWKSEFVTAHRLGISIMEWTLDSHRLHENPLLTPIGQKTIKILCNLYKLKIPSLTGDCFMQAPFWKACSTEFSTRANDFCAVVNACYKVGIDLMVIPLVDEGRLETKAQQDLLTAFLLSKAELFRQLGIKIVFETDLEPREFGRFINSFPSETFGINYDIGNSASLGYDPVDEFRYIGSRIENVHVKDRIRNGPTVPLLKGSADLNLVFSLLTQTGYRGNLILQTARAENGKDVEILSQYFGVVEKLLDDNR